MISNVDTFRAAYIHPLKDNSHNKSVWQTIVRLIASFPPNYVFTVYDIMDSTDYKRTNILNVFTATGWYKNCPSMVEGRNKILSRLRDRDANITYYKVYEKNREKLVQLLNSI